MGGLVYAGATDKLKDGVSPMHNNRLMMIVAAVAFLVIVWFLFIRSGEVPMEAPAQAVAPETAPKPAPK